MTLRIGLILSGCGFQDGTEVHEAVLSLLHLERAGVRVKIFAPDIDQAKVINHKSNDEITTQRRSVLEESARIARGKINSLFNAHSDELDALIVPGGFGAAMNLSDYAFRDVVDDMDVELHLKTLIQEMFDQKKPMGFMCISPVSIAGVALRNKGIQLTCGNDDGVAAKLGLLGNVHISKEADEILIDDAHNIVSTPAYMLARNIVEADEGISKLIEEVIRRAKAYKTVAKEEVETGNDTTEN